MVPNHPRSHRSIRGPRFGFFRILILSGSFAVVDMDYYSKPAVPRKYSAQIFSPLAKTGFVHYNILRKSGIGAGALSSAPAGPSNHRGVAQLVARLLWECRGAIRDGARRNAAKPCDTCVCGISSDCRKRHKSGFDHRNDHRQKNL